MSHIYIESDEFARGLEQDLSNADRIALDCEAAGFHRYSDRLCLMQITIEDRTYIVDPLGFDPTALVRGPLEDPDVEILMHGADFDLRLLSRDLGVRLRGLTDTQVYASLAGEEALGLQSLLESRLGVKLSKKYQRADWAQRPLSESMLEYAAEDTRHLHRLTEKLEADLERLGRTPWAREECRALEAVADEPEDEDPVDPVTRIKGARDLSPRQVTALREALEWRDEIARERDRAPFRVVGERPLTDAVAKKPRRVEELLDIRGFPKALARSDGKELIRRLHAVTQMSDDELEPYPPSERRGSGRPPPEVEARFRRLKEIRNREAAKLDLPRGILLANAVLTEIARASPETRDELLAVEGMRSWKADVLGDALLSEVARG
ncbi:MAG: HRDC domain-containing protein [Longimicrobiales bacterium]|nr:HRDC domain-containing protein [Longimicrobiales bacterium]